MRSLCLMVSILLAGAGALAQVSPQVDQAEVLRLGDCVQHLGAGIQGDERVDEFVQAMGPPASDADKWFITVLTTQGCAPCQRLKHDFATSPSLLALANPNDAKRSWAHYNVYDAQDQSQSFRFENVRVTGYPTVLVQPPRSGKYGDPKTVVFQGLYGGDPQRLAGEISGAIRQYVTRLSDPKPLAAAGGAGHGIDPPWQPVPRDEPYNPQLPAVFPNHPAPLVPPQAPTPPFPWSSVLTLVTAGFSVPAAVALGIWLVYFVRSRREAAGKPLLLDQATLDGLAELLKSLAESAPKSTPKS